MISFPSNGIFTISTGGSQKCACARKASMPTDEEPDTGSLLQDHLETFVLLWRLVPSALLAACVGAWLPAWRDSLVRRHNTQLSTPPFFPADKTCRCAPVRHTHPRGTQATLASIRLVCPVAEHVGHCHGGHSLSAGRHLARPRSPSLTRVNSHVDRKQACARDWPSHGGNVRGAWICDEGLASYEVAFSLSNCAASRHD